MSIIYELLLFFSQNYQCKIRKIPCRKICKKYIDKYWVHLYAHRNCISKILDYMSVEQGSAETSGGLPCQILHCYGHTKLLMKNKTTGFPLGTI